MGGYFFDSNEYYLGSWKNGFREGYGLQYFDKDYLLYEGEFKLDLKNGVGSIFLGNKDFYEGEFINDLYEGQGTYNWNNESCWIGKFKKGRQNGEGVLITHEGFSIIKVFEDGNLKENNISVDEEDINNLTDNSIESDKIKQVKVKSKITSKKKFIDLSELNKEKKKIKKKMIKINKIIDKKEYLEYYYSKKMRYEFGELFN